jgi:hypothetical protein
MNIRRNNPFNITKAADLTDEQINNFWVDYATDGGFEGFVKPTSPVPMLIKGGKGSGKTHIMRYFSYPAQKERYKENTLNRLVDDGYVGLYVLLGGLNSLRFRGYGKDEEYWTRLFAYYMDLWLSQVVLGVLDDIMHNNEKMRDKESVICDEITSLLRPKPDVQAKTISDLIGVFKELQEEIDDVANNFAFDGAEDAIIRSSPGLLVFEIPKVISRHILELSKVQYLYLVDELENLLEYQQKYINTLVRHRMSPSSIKVGTRLHGIKTLKTLSAGETNKEGSEFEFFTIDTQLREKSRKKSYSEFSRSLCLKRVIEAGYNYTDKDKHLWDDFFQSYNKDHFLLEDTRFVVDKYAGAERPYFESLRKKLIHGLETKSVVGVSSEKDITQVIKNISFPDYPLVEKVCILLLYKAWSSKKLDLLNESLAIKEEAQIFINSPTLKGPVKTVMGHFKYDFLAQLLREGGQKQRYLGMEAFIDMSSALPRHLLIILKHVFQWAQFNGEEPFERGNKISIVSQQKGILEASDWFYRDARIIGEDAQVIINSIDRIATLLKSLRYTDKPSECSLSTFSVNHTQVTARSLKIIEQAENSLLLIKIGGGQRDRNSKRIDEKYQLNPMLCPRWDLPIARRGAIALSAEEANAIFDSDFSDQFEGLMKERVSRMMAPFIFRKMKRKSQSAQGELSIRHE